MADVDPRPFPPGEYPVVVVGSGPGGLETSYFLRRLGVDHAVISKDDAPGGMFRRFPLFDRLISWTKPYAPVAPDTREYEWYDWNSLLVTPPDTPVHVADFMDGTSEFPSRREMEASLVAFAERHGVAVRYDCTWEATRRTGDGFVLATSDGEYRCRVAVFAVGVTEPWKPPDIPGVEHVPHYMEMKPAEAYAGKSLYILGKATSAFEVADGLLPWASRMVLSSPHEVRLSVIERSLAGLRARYTQPMEDHAIGGRSVLLLDAATERIDRTATGYRVFLMGTTQPWNLELDVDEAVIATGVSTPLGDLPEIGVATYSRGGRLPAQTPFWESASVPGIYFTGSITQGAIGLRRATGAGAVHGFRYAARMIAEHIAERFGVRTQRPLLRPDEVVPLLLPEATSGPELWNQRSYLARAVAFDPDAGVLDEGVVPLAHFVDARGPDAVAVAVVADDERRPRAVAYVRRGTAVEEHLLEPSLLLDFRSGEHEAQLRSALKGLLP
ncbi:MAG TPA: NAD(P)-binding domain-containing protein [Actinomycetota bacterium]|nr:NAD(P)-binding domain-containing protein [Actinomycetota bacterium]